MRDVLAAGDFWGGSGSVACQEFITQLGRNFQTIYEQANSHGQKVQTAGNNMCQHRLRRRRQLGLTPHHQLWPAHPPVCGPQLFSGRQPDECGSTLERNPIRCSVAEPTALQPDSTGSARCISWIANTCEKDMSFVTTTCVAGRIGDHGGYVGFRT